MSSQRSHWVSHSMVNPTTFKTKVTPWIRSKTIHVCRNLATPVFHSYMGHGYGNQETSVARFFRVPRWELHTFENQKEESFAQPQQRGGFPVTRLGSEAPVARHSGYVGPGLSGRHGEYSSQLRPSQSSLYDFMYTKRSTTQGCTTRHWDSSWGNSLTTLGSDYSPHDGSTFNGSSWGNGLTTLESDYSPQDWSPFYNVHWNCPFNNRYRSTISTISVYG